MDGFSGAALCFNSRVNARTEFAKFLNMRVAFLENPDARGPAAGPYNYYDALVLRRDCCVSCADVRQQRQLFPMTREFSAGGVVLRRMRGRWWIAVIEPQNTTGVIALPKGAIDPGERPEATAQREIREETGVEAELIRKLTDIKYVYVRN